MRKHSHYVAALFVAMVLTMNYVSADDKEKAPETKSVTLKVTGMT